MSEGASSSVYMKAASKRGSGEEGDHCSREGEAVRACVCL